MFMYCIPTPPAVVTAAAGAQTFQEWYEQFPTWLHGQQMDFYRYNNDLHLTYFICDPQTKEVLDIGCKFAFKLKRFKRVEDMAPATRRAYVLDLTREQIIDWLCYNDPNGIYRDKDSLAECGDVLTKEQAAEIMLRQIAEGEGEIPC